MRPAVVGAEVVGAEVVGAEVVGSSHRMPAGTPASSAPITTIMSRAVTCVSPDVPIEGVLELITHGFIGCLPVVDRRGIPVGMITKRDIVEQLACLLHGAGDERSPTSRSLSPRTAEEVMLPIAFTLNESATINSAACLMTLEDLHHVPVVDSEGAVSGVVSSLDIVRWLARAGGEVPPLSTS